MAAYCVFKNFGKTPAFIKRVVGGLSIIDPNNRSTFQPVNEEAYSGSFEPILPPGEKTPALMFTSNSLADSREEFPDLVKLKKLMILHGIVEYADAFGRNHKSKFCYVYNFGRAQGFNFTFGPPEFNDYT